LIAYNPLGAWSTRLYDLKYVPSQKVFMCNSTDPDAYSPTSLGIGLNYATFGLSNIADFQKEASVSKFHNSSGLVTFMDVPYDVNNCNGYYGSISQGIFELNPNAYHCISIRHNKAANCAFFDGHVDSLRYPEVQDTKYWRPRLISNILTMD
jgi:prepilin-type processing-associated H-X9-DG protein